MRRKWVAGAGAFRPKMVQLEDRAVPATLLVDDDRADRPGAQFTSIQDAVDAADENDRILVYPGTYTEQVVISGSDKDGLSIRSVRRWQAEVVAPDELTGAPAIIRVSDADRVTVDGFLIEGPAAG